MKKFDVPTSHCFTQHATILAVEPIKPNDAEKHKETIDVDVEGSYGGTDPD